MNAHVPPPPAPTIQSAYDLSPEGATPVMAQFIAAKQEQPDALVFFRMGDFFELFFDDAEVAAKALGLALTKRGKHRDQDIPMAGVPVHAMDGYLARLIRQGFRVAICEQLESPEAAKKRGSKAIVSRGVVRVVTPGTLTEDSLLDARGANRLAAISVRKGQAAVAVIELSSGAVEVVGCAPDDLAATLAAFRPSEVLVPDRLFSDPDLAAALNASGGSSNPCPRPRRIRRPASGASPPCMASRRWTPLGCSNRPRFRPWVWPPPIWRRPRRDGGWRCRHRAGLRTRGVWPSTRPPARVWRSTAPRTAGARAACSIRSTAPSRPAAPAP